MYLSLSFLFLRFFDLRTQSSLHSWKLQFPNGGVVRCLACAENWVAIGNNNGLINILDVRTGELLTSWKPSDFYPNPVSPPNLVTYLPISVTQYSFALNPKATSWSDSLYQLRPTRRGNLVTSVGQGLVSLWRPTYGKLIHPLKCPAHPVHCMEVCGDQFITVSSNGHLAVHDGFEINVSVWVITVSVWVVIGSVWVITVSVWVVIVSVWVITVSVWVVIASVWVVTMSVWVITVSVWVVTVSVCVQASRAP